MKDTHHKHWVCNVHSSNAHIIERVAKRLKLPILIRKYGRGMSCVHTCGPNLVELLREHTKQPLKNARSFA